MESTTAEKVCAIRENVVGLIGPSRYRTWFGGGTEFHLDGERLDVTVSNAFVGNWINSNYLPQLVEAARAVVGCEPEVAIHVCEEDAGSTDGEPAKEPTPKVASPTRQSALAGARRKPATALRGRLQDFVVGPSNELAYSVGMRLVHDPGQAFKHLVLYAGCGLGKTHLLQGICNAINDGRPELEWRYLSGEEFTNEFVYAFKAGRIDGFRARFRNVDVLVIDDIHFLANKKATQEEFLHTFNAIDASGKTVIMSSDSHPRNIATLSEPLVNRLIAAMVVEISPPDLATRREILRRRAAAMNCSLPEELLDFLAQRITRNVRELEGALYKLTAYASLTREPLTLELARRTVEDYVSAAPAPAAGQIERLVGQHFGVTREALHSRTRDRTTTHARSIAMYLIRKHTRMSFPEIGRAMGNKQHSTVLMAVRRVEELLKRDGRIDWSSPAGHREESVARLIDELEQQLARGCTEDD